MQDLKKLIAEREAHLAAWARIMEPEIREVDPDHEIARLFGELWGPYHQMDRGKRERVRDAIRKRRWPADFAIGWYLRGRDKSDAL